MLLQNPLFQSFPVIKSGDGPGAFRSIKVFPRSFADSLFINLKVQSPPLRSELLNVVPGTVEILLPPRKKCLFSKLFCSHYKEFGNLRPIFLLECFITHFWHIIKCFMKKKYSIIKNAIFLSKVKKKLNKFMNVLKLHFAYNFELLKNFSFHTFHTSVLFKDQIYKR